MATHVVEVVRLVVQHKQVKGSQDALQCPGQPGVATAAFPHGERLSAVDTA